jgi:hypothetical protein
MNRIPSVVWRSLAFLAITAIVLFYTMESKGFEDCIRSRDNEASKKESGPFLVLVPRPLTCTVRVFDKHNGTLVALFTLTLWFTTQATLAHFRREFLVTHRPKLTIRQVAFLPNSNDPAIEFTLVNTGESTATIIESSVKPWIFAIAGEWPPVPPYDPPTTKPRTKTLANGESVRWKETDQPPHAHLLIGDIADDKLETMLLGYILYADDNGTRRRIGFCRRRVSGTNRFIPADNPDYEYAD